MASADSELELASIAELHAAMRAGQLTATQLVEQCSARIAACDQQGANLNAVVVSNEQALDQARQCDAALKDSGALTGALHGIPVVVKDCLETTTMPTSFGSEIFAEYMAAEDATVIRRLRDAGAIILAKTTLPDWATSWFAYSSVSGETRNPYDLARDPGGSSSGTGAAVAAGYAPIGLGTDCGGSVRLPSSFCNLVGVRSTPGLIPRTGCNPLVGVQDTIGPMGRSVEDIARVFSVLAGYDPADPLSAVHRVARAPRDYVAGLQRDALVGARIGVLRSAFGSDDDPAARAVNEVIAAALDELAAGGACLVDVEIPDLGDWLVRTSLYIAKSRHDIDEFLAARPNAPLQSVAAIVASGRYHPKLDLLEAIAEGPEDPFSSMDYFHAYTARADFAQLVADRMTAQDLAVLVYPTAQVAAPTRAETDSGHWTTLTFPTNTLIGSQTWMPALTVPAGLTSDGLPVGMEVLALPYDEPTMFRIAHGFEQVAGHRTFPAAIAGTL